MHCVFGTKQAVEYITRKGAYLIPIRDDRIAVIHTSKGYFLLGGGIMQGETDAEAILRECLEETGCPAVVQKFVCSAEAYLEHPVLGHFHPVQRYYFGELHKQEVAPTEQGHLLQWVPYEAIRGNLFVQMQNWALDMCWTAYHEK